jgi:hypothetical protein
MEENTLRLLKRLCESELSQPLETTPPTAISAWQAVELLWPLNEVFKPHLQQIRSIRYEKRFESEADDAIERLAFAWALDSWETVSPGAWRVLLERQQQGIAVAIANMKEVAPFMPVPVGLSRDAQRGFVVLFLLHAMKLPFPVADRSGLELPVGDPPASLSRH